MKDLKIYLLIAFSLLSIYLLVEYNKPRPIDWSPSYNKTDKIPFGLYVLYHELPQLFQQEVHISRQSIYETLRHPAGANLLIVSPKVDLSATDYSKMRTYMEQGNTVFIAAPSYNFSLLDSLKLGLRTHDMLLKKGSLSFHFVNPKLHSEKHYQFERGIAATYFSKFDTVRTKVIARNDKNEAIFIHYSFGKGGLYLLASADFFSNYALLSNDGGAFASLALSYLPAHKQVLFDEYQALGRYGGQSMLNVIFSNSALKWAYYIILGCLVLFVLYNSKRRQRIIPLEDPMKNTSVDFVKVVSGVYYQQRDNKDIVHKKIIYLLHFIRNNYRLKTGDLNTEFRDTLISRSGVQEDIIDAIIREIKAVNLGKYLSDQELIVLNDHIEQFYEQSGITWNKNFLNNEPI